MNGICLLSSTPSLSFPFSPHSSCDSNVCPGLRSTTMEQIDTFSARTPASSLRRASLKCHDQGRDVMEQSYIIPYTQGSAPSHLVLSLSPHSPPVGTGTAGATPPLCKYISQNKLSLPGVLFHQQTFPEHIGQRVQHTAHPALTLPHRALVWLGT